MRARVRVVCEGKGVGEGNERGEKAVGEAATVSRRWCGRRRRKRRRDVKAGKRCKRSGRRWRGEAGRQDKMMIWFCGREE